VKGAESMSNTIPTVRLPSMRIFAILLLLGAGTALAQQVADTDFAPRVSAPAFADGKGPRVAIDEAHFNFHTADGRYAPFAQLLRGDGFVVTPLKQKPSSSALADIDVLVIANALNERNVEEWSLPTPSAFSAEEIAAVHDWVQAGGALLLIADHMPFGGAAADLASAFGMSFTNGYAVQADRDRPSYVFQRADGSLKEHAITRGRAAEEAITSVTTFTGQAFSATGAKPVFEVPADAFLLLTETAGEFSAETPRQAAAGLLQGATLSVGMGRVAAFGEAAMFSAQLAGPQKIPMGMNAPGAEQNAQFVLNVMHWLVGLLPE
jgi:hypothetical protein